MPNRTPDRITRHVSSWLIQWRWVLLAFGSTLVVAAYFPARSLDFDRSFENMFAEDDPLLVPYRQLQRAFGGDDVALAAYDDPDLMTPEGMQRVATLTAKLAAVDGVESVASLTTTPLGPEIITDDARGPTFLDLLEGYNVSADRKTTAVACTLDPNASSDDRTTTVNRMREVVKAHHADAVLVGGPVMVVEGFRIIEEDGNRLGWISTVLLMLTIVACFRSLRWVAIPIVIVNATLILTKAVLVLSGLPLSMVSSMLWSIITVQGIATVIHIAVRFREGRSAGASPREALLLAGTLLMAPIFWTCVTDAAGFGALLFAEVGPVHDFGLMMAVGSLLALVAVALFLPGLTLAGNKYTDPQVAWGEGRLTDGLRHTMDLVIRRPKTIAAAALLVVVAAAIGCYRLEVESDFTKNFRASSEIVRSYGFVEERLGGAGVWDLIVPAPPPEQLNARYLRALRVLQKKLRSDVTLEDEQGNAIPGLTKVMSIVDGHDTVAKPPPFWKGVVVRFKQERFEKQMPDIAQALYGEDPEQPGKYYARIMLRANERQSSVQKQKLIDSVTQISRKMFPGTEKIAPAEVTGFFVLLTNIVDSMLRDQWLTFGIATAAIGIMMLFAFRSLLLALVALIPNVLPILVVTGLMGWLGVKINMGAAMIAAVSMGLSVDAEIHYVAAFQRLRREGQSVSEALHNVHQSVGRAVVFSTIVLMVGFGALCLSDFIPTVYFGALVTLAFAGGLFGNLIVLPLLLRLVIRDKTPQSTPVPVTDATSS